MIKEWMKPPIVVAVGAVMGVTLLWFTLTVAMFLFGVEWDDHARGAGVVLSMFFGAPGGIGLAIYICQEYRL